MQSGCWGSDLPDGGASTGSHPCARAHTRERRAAAGSLLCGACIRQMEHHLQELPALHRECLHQASPTAMVRPSNPTKVSASRNVDHLDIAVLDTRHHLSSLLASWTGTVVDQLGTAAPARSVPDLARFLAENLDWLTAQPAAPDLADEIESLVRQLRRIVDPESSEYFTFVKECVMDGCDGTITATLRPGEGAPARRIACTAGHAWETHEWLRLRHLMERRRKGGEA